MSGDLIFWKLLEYGVEKSGELVLDKLLRNRRTAAQAILREELARGTKSLHDVPDEDAAAAVFRYLRAAQEGTARRNLRLMAQVMANLEPKSPTLYADEFLALADTLASMRREELIVVAALYRAERTVEQRPRVLIDEKIIDEANHEMRANLRAAGVFAAEGDIDQWLASAMRTGLVIGRSAWGGMSFYTSSLMGKLVQLADIEGVLNSES
jgi:hypothetical protein